MTLHITEKGATYTEPAWPATPPNWGEVGISEWLLMEACKDFTADPGPRTFQQLRDRFVASAPRTQASRLLVHWLDQNKTEIKRVTSCVEWERSLNMRLYWAWLHVPNRDADGTPDDF